MSVIRRNKFIILAAAFAAAVMLALMLPASTAFGSTAKTVSAEKTESTVKIGNTIKTASGTKTKAKRTVLVYMIASSLEYEDGTYSGFATSDLTEMMNADTPSDVNIVLECGGTEKWYKHGDMLNGTVSRCVIKDGDLKKVDDLGAIPMTTTGSLSDFITWGTENYPAEDYVLVLWDHGGGSPLTYGVDYLNPIGNGYTDIELMQELETAGVSFESVIFEACLMCSLEVGMALHDYADYMVAAESVTYDQNIDYEAWLPYADSNDPKDYLKAVVDGYEDYVTENDLQSCMSIIDLDEVPDVYKAYVKYVTCLKEDLDDGKYSDILQARALSGTFEGSDSVDIITLAVNYQTAASTKLINSVINATSHTFSTLSYGHGMTVYSPFLRVTTDSSGMTRYGVYDYTKGRKSFAGLGYDDIIADYYDAFESMVYTAFLPNYVKNYAGSRSWFKTSYAKQITENQSEDTVYGLSVTTGDKYSYIALGDQWDMITSVYLTLYFDGEDDLGEYTVIGGSEYKNIQDSEGNLVFSCPKTWITYVDPEGMDHIVTSYSTGYTDNGDGTTAQTYRILAEINGEQAYLMVSIETEDGVATKKILGYHEVDFSDGTYNTEDLKQLEDDDEVTMIQEFIEGEEHTYYTAGDPIKAEDLEIGYEHLNWDDIKENFTPKGFYTITDCYGNTYQTAIVELADAGIAD